MDYCGDSCSVKDDMFDESTCIIQLQGILMSLLPENYENTIQVINNFQFLKNTRKYGCFVTNLYFTVEYRPNLIVNLSKLIKSFCNNLNDDEIRDKFCELLILYGLYSHFSDNNTYLYGCRLCFLKTCLDLGVFEMKKLMIHINGFWKSCQSQRILLCKIFTWFAPEILELEQTFFLHMHSILVFEYTSQHLSEEYGYFINKFDSYRKDDWRIWKDLVKHVCQEDTVELAIRNNDVIALEKMMELYSFDINKRVEPNTFEPCWFLQKYPTLIMYTAYYGSSSCFFYLLKLGANTSVFDEAGNSLSNFAIAGGNIEIIMSCEKNCGLSIDSLHIAALFHHYNVFQWIYRTKKFDMTLPTPQYSTVLRQAIYSNNLRTFQFCIKNNPDISLNGVLRYAALRGSCDIIRYMHLMKDHILLDSIDSDGRTPLHNAVKNGHFAAVEALISNHCFDINQKDNLGNTPLMYAVKSGNYLVVQVLLAAPSIDINSCDNQFFFVVF